METTVDLSALFELADWTPESYARLQEAGFADADSVDRFKTHLGRLERDATTESGDVKALALKVGLAYRLLGQHRTAADWLAKARPSGMRDIYLGRSLRELGRYDEAIEAFGRAASAGWDALESACESAETLILKGDIAAAEALLNEHAGPGARAAVWHFVSGRLHEARGDIEAALAAHERAVELAPDDGRMLFRLAFLYDLHGNDDGALELYEKCARLPVVSANALVNLSVMYEDLDDYPAARSCLLRVLATHPNHERARLFLKDIEASEHMIIDEEMERARERRSAVLDIPVSEFELSVRSRNCLKKMDINTLGDLLRISEAELLAYKNFGETSLNEIKAMLTQKGLALGQFPEGFGRPVHPEPRKVAVTGNPELLNRPVAELELSVRSRKCLQRLGINSLADLCARTEQELLTTRNFGQTSLNEIKRRLTELGLHLRRVGD